jgi:hypothetical protein
MAAATAGTFKSRLARSAASSSTLIRSFASKILLEFFSVGLRNVKWRQSSIDLVAGRKMTSLPELTTHIDFSQWAEA